MRAECAKAEVIPRIGLRLATAQRPAAARSSARQRVHAELSAWSFGVSTLKRISSSTTRLRTSRRASCSMKPLARLRGESLRRRPPIRSQRRAASPHGSHNSRVARVCHSGSWPSESAPPTFCDRPARSRAPSLRTISPCSSQSPERSARDQTVCIYGWMDRCLVGKTCNLQCIEPRT